MNIKKVISVKYLVSMKGTFAKKPLEVVDLQYVQQWIRYLAENILLETTPGTSQIRQYTIFDSQSILNINRYREQLEAINVLLH